MPGSEKTQQANREKDGEGRPVAERVFLSRVQFPHFCLHFVHLTIVCFGYGGGQSKETAAMIMSVG